MTKTIKISLFTIFTMLCIIAYNLHLFYQRVPEDKHDLAYQCIQDIQTDIEKISDKYPELSGWKINSKIENRQGLVLSYSYRFLPSPEHRYPHPSNFEDNGIYIYVAIYDMDNMPDKGTMVNPVAWFKNIRLASGYLIYFAEKHSSDIESEIKNILLKHIELLRIIDANKK